MSEENDKAEVRLMLELLVSQIQALKAENDELKAELEAIESPNSIPKSLSQMGNVESISQKRMIASEAMLKENSTSQETKDNIELAIDAIFRYVKSGARPDLT